MVEKLNKQLIPLLLPKVPKNFKERDLRETVVSVRQRVLAVLKICSLSSEVANPGF